MQYRFIKDFPPTNYKKGDVVLTANDNYCTNYADYRTYFGVGELATFLALGIVEEVSEVKEEWPQRGDKYWRINEYGQINSTNWVNDAADGWRRDFLGVYRSEAEAIEVRDKIKNFVKGLK